MKANEFVKKFGWCKVKEIIKNAPDWAFETAGINDYANSEWSKIYPVSAYCKMDDLKRLVESWELVNFYGGVDDAKQALDAMHFDVYAKAHLKQAIADVESCQ